MMLYYVVQIGILGNGYVYFITFHKISLVSECFSFTVI